MFAALDAFMIGANDVANSFATSVSSKSLTLKQACLAAMVMEFLGGVLVGARVADTIKNGVISSTLFQGNPGVQMLGFACALVSSSIWLTICTRFSWPVSTTYSIVSAVAGVGVALGGIDAPNWGWNGGKGIATIFAGFGIAPAISAAFGAIVYLLIKYVVLVRDNPTRWGLYTAPFFFFTLTAVLTLSIIYKGAPSLGLTSLEPNVMAAAVVGTAFFVKKDYTIRWYHFFLGPLLWRREAPTDSGHHNGPSAIPDYRVNRKNESEAPEPKTAEDTDVDSEKNSSHIAPQQANKRSPLSEQVEDPHPIEGSWIEPQNLWIIARYKAIPWLVTLFTHGTSVDIHDLQVQEGSKEASRMQEMYDRAKQYPNDTEHLYSFMQVMTACTASFAHGANDLSNAIGPFAVIYHVWKTGEIADKKSPVEIWNLVFGAVCLCIGLATYGYNIMRVLGNRITLHSPSRGFSMELGASITVILASQYGLPVSTTMCIIGSTIGVALCNGDWRATNWRAILWIFSGWVLTVPIVATGAGCLMAIILNAPHF
ncbi:hypothetical protein QCA50_007513 [Cerrena zonata]|uniref:Phosphate transporter n=1 Tax=Cerrena zonata TaxID=2478898 RepID=A0AAW0GG35_9APHY